MPYNILKNLIIVYCFRSFLKKCISLTLIRSSYVIRNANLSVCPFVCQSGYRIQKIKMYLNTNVNFQASIYDAGLIFFVKIPLIQQHVSNIILFVCLSARLLNITHFVPESIRDFVINILIAKISCNIFHRIRSKVCRLFDTY